MYRVLAAWREILQVQRISIRKSFSDLEGALLRKSSRRRMPAGDLDIAASMEDFETADISSCGRAFS
jgi:hypothetical protein